MNSYNKDWVSKYENLAIMLSEFEESYTDNQFKINGINLISAMARYILKEDEFEYRYQKEIMEEFVNTSDILERNDELLKRLGKKAHGP